MTTDRILAALALLGVAAFVAPIVLMVPEPALIVVLLIGIGMAAYDFWRELWRQPRDHEQLVEERR